MLSKFFLLLNRDLLEADQKAQRGLSKLKQRKQIQIGDHNVVIESKIAEGGYADVFRVAEAKKTGDFSLLNTESKEYALKRMFIPADNSKAGQRLAESENGGLMAHGDAGVAAHIHASDEAVDKVRKAYECEVHIMS